MGEINQVLIAQLRADMNAFVRDISRGLGQTTQAIQNFSRQSSQAFDRVEQSSNQIARGTRTLSAGFSQLRTLLVGLGLANIAREGFQLATSFAAAERVLLAVTGNTKAAGEAFNFVREQSRRLGTDLRQGIGSFARMADAARDTVLEGEGVRRIFEGIGITTTALGLDTDRYRRILLATEQILARGAIQTEELNQLTEAGIPIRKELATVLGITGRELAKSLEQGLVPSEALLLVTERLREKYSDLADTVSRTTPIAFATLTSTVQESTAQFFQAILRSEELNQFIRSLTTSITTFTSSLDTASITAFVDQIIRLGANIARFGSQVAEFFQQLERLTTGRIRDLFTGLLPSAEQVQSTVQRQLEGLGVSTQAAANIGKLYASVVGTQAKANTGFADSLKTVNAVLDDFTGNNQGLTEYFRSIKQGSTFFTEVEESAEDANKKMGTDLKALEAQIKKTFEANRIKGEIEKRRKADEEAYKKQIEAAEDAHQIRKEALEREIEQRLKNDETIVESAIERFEKEEQLEKESSENRLKTVLNRLKEEADAYAKGQEKAIDDRLKLQEKEAEKTEQIFEHMGDNIQDIFSDVVSSALKGDLDSVKDFFTTVRDLAADTAAEMGTALFVRPFIDNAVKELQKVFAGQMKFGDVSTGTKVLTGVIGGIGAGYATSSFLGQAGVSGTTNRVISGAVGGAALGTAIYPGVGTVVGGAVGAAGGYLSGLFGGGPKAQNIALQTTAGRPFSPSDNAVAPGAFGMISLINDQSKRTNAQQISNFVAEFDRAIFNMATARQRQYIESALQAPANNQFVAQGAADTDEALSRLFAHRSRVILESLAGRQVAENVVGNVEGADPNALQRRVEDALSILRQIEEFERGPTTQTADAIRAIHEEFDILVSRAEEFGIATAAIEAERQERIAAVGENINKNVAQRTLELLNPAAAAHAALTERHHQEYKEARDANADLTALARLHALERRELANQMAQADQEITESAREGLLKSIDDFILASRQLSPAQQEIHGVSVQFIELRNEARRLNESTTALEAAYRARVAQIQREAQLNRILTIATGGGGDTRTQIEQVFRAFVESGRAINPLVQQLEGLRHEYARLSYAAQLAGRSTADLRQSYIQQIQQLVVQAKNSALDILVSFEDPFTRAKFQIGRQLKEMAELVARGLLPRNYLVGVEQRVRAGAAIDEALRRIGGGAGTPIEQVADAFQTFIRAGNPLNQTGQELAALADQFSGLISAAHLLGFSTRDLEKSYLAQSRAIRERLIADIENQLSAQIQGIESINSLLQSFRVSENLPGNLRLSAAQSQFQQALKTQDTQQIIQSANQLREIARGQFGSASGFFSIQNQIEKALTAFRDQQQAQVEAERRRLTEQVNRDVERNLLARSSLGVLRQVSNSQSDTSRGISDLLIIAQQSIQESRQTRQLLAATLAAGRR